MATQADGEFADYIAARLPSLRRLAFLLCQDRHRADDLAQSAAVRAYIHWTKASRADNTDAYVNAILVREFLHERRSAWVRRVVLSEPPETVASQSDYDSAIDLQALVAALPPRQRAVLVLRYYCDLNIYQAADTLGCSPGTVKSQTARALVTLRRAMGESADTGSADTGSANDRSAQDRSADDLSADDAARTGAVTTAAKRGSRHA